ncbi:MAG: glycosyltransferase [Prevotellaceae bacterium]|jgi:glycosyltransferase involved in cell wall biosynthesis|nr:glycosyltransferase [Prevotellaceae bacterium]
MFSIIIPLFNKEKYIEKAFQSIINQTFTEFEVLVVDDGSTDNSLEKVKQFQHSNIQIIEQPNSGVSTARNNGVKRAKYDYICFLDADDWWESTFLEEMARLINDFPNAGIYGTSYFKVKNGKNIPAQIGVAQGFTRGYFDYLQAYINSPWMPLWTGAVCVPKQIFDEMNGFKPALKLGEDFDLWVRIALKYPTALINSPLSYYNQDVEQAARAVGRKLHQPENHMLFALHELYNQEDSNPKLKQLMDNQRTYGLFPYYLNKDTRQAAVGELNRVNWSKQPKAAYKKYYQTPIWFLKLKYQLLVMASIIKNILK